MRAQYLFDLRSSSLSVLTNSFFFSGNFDQAADCAKMNIEAATRSAHPNRTVSRVHQFDATLFFGPDNLEQIEHSLAKLEHTAERYSLAPARAVRFGDEGPLPGPYRANSGWHTTSAGEFGKADR